MKKLTMIVMLGIIFGGSMPLMADPERVYGTSSALVIDNREEGVDLRMAVEGDPAEVLYDLAVKKGTKSYQGVRVIWSYEGWNCFHVEDSHLCFNDVTVAEPWKKK